MIRGVERCWFQNFILVSYPVILFIHWRHRFNDWCLMYTSIVPCKDLFLISFWMFPLSRSARTPTTANSNYSLFFGPEISTKFCFTSSKIIPMLCWLTSTIRPDLHRYVECLALVYSVLYEIEIKIWMNILMSSCLYQIWSEQSYQLINENVFGQGECILLILIHVSVGRGENSITPPYEKRTISRY